MVGGDLTGTAQSEYYGPRDKTKRYPKTRFRGKNTYYHKIIYEYHHGKVPDGKEIDHACSNKWCLNPNHLIAVTHSENQSNRNWYGTSASSQWRHKKAGGKNEPRIPSI